MIMSRRLRLTAHVAQMGRKRNAYRKFGEKVKRKESTRKTKTLGLREIRMEWCGLG
jgi:hypothetical protein